MEHKLVVMQGYKCNGVLYCHAKFIQMFDYVQQ